MIQDKDIAKFSLHRALLQAARNEGQLKGCFEAEIHTELQRSMKDLGSPMGEPGMAIRSEGGFYVPTGVLFRDLLSTSGSGANTVQSDVGSPIQLLRAKSVCAQLGAQVFENLKGNLVLPRQTLGATLDWLAEQGTANQNDYEMGQLTLTPHRCAGVVKYTKQLVAQTSGAVERYLRNDLSAAFAAILDKAGLAGTGASNQPQGILSTTGVGSVTFGAAATLAKVCDLESAVGEASADTGSMGWATSPAVRKKWRQIERSAQGNGRLWEDGNRVLGMPAAATKGVSSNQVIHGNFADLIFGLWGEGVELQVNPYSFASTGTVQMVLTAFADVGVLHPESFAISSDSGAQ